MHDPSTKVHVRLFTVSGTISILDNVFIRRHKQSLFACTRANQLAKYSSNVVHTLHCNCNNKTRLGVYQRYYSVLCNTLPYPVKQREALCENYRITCKYTYEVGGGGEREKGKNCYKMYY